MGCLPRNDRRELNRRLIIRAWAVECPPNCLGSSKNRVKLTSVGRNTMQTRSTSVEHPGKDSEEYNDGLYPPIPVDDSQSVVVEAYGSRNSRHDDDCSSAVVLDL